MKKCKVTKCVVWQNKSNKQKCVTIPKDCPIKPGDYVTIVRKR